MKKNRIFILIILLFLLFGIKTTCQAVCTCTCTGFPKQSWPATDENNCRMSICGLNNPMISCVVAGQAPTQPATQQPAKTAPQTTPKTQDIPRQPVKLTDPLGIGGNAPAGQEVQYLIGRIIKVIMGLVGYIALLLFVYGGFFWGDS